MTTGSSAASTNSSKINSALSSAPANTYVLLPAGTWSVTNITIPSNRTLRGAGANSTILDGRGSGDGMIIMGLSSSATPGTTGAVNVTGGNTAGSSSITVASASGMSVGGYIEINELNDASYVTKIGIGGGSCDWCDGYWNGTRLRGQISEITSVSGNTIGISPPLYTNYGVASGTGPALAIPFTAAAKYAGLENLQLYANNTGYGAMILMSESAYSWVKGVHINFSDRDVIGVYSGYRNEIRDSYIHDDFVHHSGTTDSDIFLVYKTTGVLVENNIIGRLHVGVMPNWGAAGNVIAYNYFYGNYDDGLNGANDIEMVDVNFHGAHPQFNLIEGNVLTQYRPDAFWGSSSHNTFFRNWSTGITQVCQPFNARGPLTNCHTNTQGLDAVNLDFTTSRHNLVGNVLGSAALKAGAGSGEVPVVVASETRSNYNSPPNGYDLAIGYGGIEESTGSGTCTSTRAACVPFSSSLLFGNYTNANSTLTWELNVPSGYSPAHPSQTLPASFYKSSKPAWWGSFPWPAIGPNVTGGTGPGGHASLTASNPAQACFNNTAKDSNGILKFDPSACYGAAPGGGTTAPAPPTNLGIVVH